MQRYLYTAIIVIALYSTCYADAQFYIEDKALKPVPDSIVQPILKSEKAEEWKACKFIGKTIDLDGDGKAEDFAVTTEDGCNCGNAICTIWVLRYSGNHYTVILSDGGYSMSIGKKRQKGLADISVEASTAGWSQKNVWVFDGKRYIKVKNNR
ncbi:MAG: hypothetical protein WC405_01420 [Syntrophales bacterium]